MGMMFEVKGDVTVTPTNERLVGATSGVPSVGVPLNESIELQQAITTRVVLSSDSPVAVGLNGMSGVHAIQLRADGKVRARLTSADGSQQAIPVDKLLVLISESVPFTALDLTRVAGTETIIDVTFGQKV